MQTVDLTDWRTVMPVGNDSQQECGGDLLERVKEGHMKDEIDIKTVSTLEIQEKQMQHHTIYLFTFLAEVGVGTDNII